MVSKEGAHIQFLLYILIFFTRSLMSNHIVIISVDLFFTSTLKKAIGMQWPVPFAFGLFIFLNLIISIDLFLF
jgi:hypothetical protein